MTNFRSALKMFLWMTVLTGCLYPFVITEVVAVIMPRKSTGSLIHVGGKTVGSALIAQKFTSNKYFWPRPSAIDYDPLHSGGSNLGPTSAALKKAVDERRDLILHVHGDIIPETIPSELLYASGSGLDPHISPEAAFFQIDRIVKARGMHSGAGQRMLQELINSMVEERKYGFLGERYVNVLLLNIALDERVSHG